MKVLKSAAAVAGFVLCLSASAFAAENDPIVGQWIDKLPDGNAMIIEFTLDRISFQGMTVEGSLVPPSVFPAIYKKEGDGQFTVAIEGQPQDPMAVMVTGKDKLSLKFPGRDSRDLVRYVPEAAAPAKPKGHP